MFVVRLVSFVLAGAGAGCGSAVPPPVLGTTGSSCLHGKAPRGTRVELRPVGFADPFFVGQIPRYQICGLPEGAYQVLFTRDQTDLLEDIVLGSAQRRQLDICEARPMLPGKRYINSVGETPSNDPGPALPSPEYRNALRNNSIERCSY